MIWLFLWAGSEQSILKCSWKDGIFTSLYHIVAKVYGLTLIHNRDYLLSKSLLEDLIVNRMRASTSQKLGEGI